MVSCVRFLKKQEEIALPSKEKEPISYYSVRYSIAPWIVKLWIDAYGEKTAERLMASSMQRLPSAIFEDKYPENKQG